jgi:asparagine synthase (glutamine-hydrolysing)
MCGILGIASRSPMIHRELPEVMRDCMRHRGPDDAGVWQSPDGRVALAQRRLAILDLSPGGHQPMSDASGQLWLTFNGEIYNYRSLREELEQRGHAFRTAGDSEVILEAYRAWGVDCVDRLNGMFAFGLLDRRAGRLFLARDRAGEKPLFYHHAAGRLAFASELKALMADPRLPRELDLEALNAYLAYGYVPGAMCILNGVRKLPQGHAMTYHPQTDRLCVWQYWRLPEPSFVGQHAARGTRHAAGMERERNENSALPPSSGLRAACCVLRAREALTDELEHLLMDSVRLRLAADVPVGILLSGGIDSSLVTALAARVSPRPVRTFTISFPGHGAYDESAHARLVARHFGTDHTELPAEATGSGSSSTVELLPELARQYDEPLADSSMVPTYLVSRLIREHATVALGGDGGDELFGGYLHYNWIQRQERLRRVVPGWLRAWTGAAAARRLPVGVRGRNTLIGFAGGSPQSIAHTNLYFDAHSRLELLSPALRAARLDLRSPESYKQDLCSDGETPLRQATAVDFMTYLVDDILVKVDRASMLASLEVRAPWLDHRIIEFAFGRVPDTLRATENERKILPRHLARRWLPAGLDVTRKQGFSLPLRSWFKGEWGRYLESVLVGADPGLFDRGMIQRLITAQRRGYSNTQRLFALALFELWRRQYRVTVPSAPGQLIDRGVR